MARISLEAAAQKRQACHDLRSQKRSIRFIASALGLPVSSVQNFLASPPDTSAVDGIAQALALKALPEHKHRGGLELEAMVSGVSRRTISRRVAAAGLAYKGNHRHAKRAPYQMEDKPGKYLDMVQMDTKKLRVDEVLLELLVIRDVYTGCTLVMHHSQTGLGMLHKVAYALSVFGGAPAIFQTDNGTTDFSMSRRHKLRLWQELALSRGVGRIQFIPEAEPYRNGSVESFNGWLQDEWDNHGRALHIGLDNFDSWLADRLYYYNYQKPLSSTGAPPASLSSGRFNLLAQDYSIDYAAPTTGCVSFIRYVSRSLDRETGCIASVAPVKNPGTIFVVPAAFEGGYLRFDSYLDGRGLVWAPREVDTLEAIRLGEKKVNGRFVSRENAGLLIGCYVSPFAEPTCPVIQIEVLPGLAALFQPTNTDPVAIARVWRKVLKQAVPEILPSGIALVIGDDGAWQAVRDGEVLWTEQSSPAVIEHAREVL